jgi:hypothetical protein
MEEMEQLPTSSALSSSSLLLSQGCATGQFMLTTTLSVSDKSIKNNNNDNRLLDDRDDDRVVKGDDHSHSSDHYVNDMNNVNVLTTGSASSVY